MIFGIVQGDTIINVIVAESQEAAEAATGYNFEVVPDVGRGWVRTADGWAAPETPKRPRELSGLGFEMHIQQAAGLSDDDVLAMLDDPALRLFWRRIGQAGALTPDHGLVADGLASIVALGHLTEAQADAVLDNWPVA